MIFLSFSSNSCIFAFSEKTTDINQVRYDIMKTKSQLRITHIFLFALVVLQLTLLSSCTRKRQKYVIAVSQCSEDIWREKLNNEMEMSTYLYDEEVELKIVSADDDEIFEFSPTGGN